MDWTCRRGSPVGGTSSLNVNKAAEQGKMEIKIESVCITNEAGCIIE